eukprot:5022909-Pyramimonas_sp.AAC.1
MLSVAHRRPLSELSSARATARSSALGAVWNGPSRSETALPQGARSPKGISIATTAAPALRGPELQRPPG